MNFTDAVKTCLLKYADFKGRAGRPEFWWFALFTLLVTAVPGFFSDLLSAVFLLATLLPSFAAGTRRLRDTGRSGWWQLLWLLPVIGWIPLIYFCAH
jgi:uncharacterized membrane protein YhaH (DUF805 family)